MMLGPSELWVEGLPVGPSRGRWLRVPALSPSRDQVRSREAESGNSQRARRRKKEGRRRRRGEDRRCPHGKARVMAVEL